MTHSLNGKVIIMTAKYPTKQINLEVEIEIENYHINANHCYCDYAGDMVPHCGLCTEDFI